MEIFKNPLFQYFTLTGKSWNTIANPCYHPLKPMKWPLHSLLKPMYDPPTNSLVWRVLVPLGSILVMNGNAELGRLDPSLYL